MSYSRNVAVPKALCIGSVLLIADGSVVTTGAAVATRLDEGAWGAGGGTLEYSATSQAWDYTPSQAETNGDVLSISVTKASCVGCSLTVLMDPTSATAEAGATAALVAINLDHLLKTPTVAEDMTDEVADNTILSRIIGGGDTSNLTGVDALYILSDISDNVVAIQDAFDAKIPQVIQQVQLGGAGVYYILAVDSNGAAITGGTGLTAQQTRDAMKLAPSAGAQAAKSIDGKLNSLNGEDDEMPVIEG